MKRVLLALLLTTVGIAQFNAQTAAPAQPQAKPQLGPNQWTVDSSHSAANFSVRHMMVTTVRGQLGPITGTVEYDGKDVKSATADVRIDVNAITTQNAKRDGHLRSDDFFDAANHPAITFKSKRVEAGSAGAFKLIGDLTIRGTTKEVALNVDGPTPPVKGMGGVRIGATATTRINRLEYGLKWNSMVEAGPVVSDEVSITIDLELTRPAPPAGTQ
jgi:polyisoprenoid-binding protein YceI